MSTWTEKSQAIPVIQAGVSDRMASNSSRSIFIKKVYSLLLKILASVYSLLGFLLSLLTGY